MRLLDSRRLRGPNLQTRGPAALAEVAFEEGEEPRRAIALWRGELARITERLGWDGAVADARARVFAGGAALTFPAPIDVLIAATEANEWAIESATRVLRDDAPDDLEPAVERISAGAAAQSRPRLVALHAEAARRGVPFLWDDEIVTLGMAKRSRSWPIDELPDPKRVRWKTLGRIPVALVTGTNGKTTSTRLVARMAKLAGLVPGHTSSDGVAIDEEIIEPGDWTGPGAARMVLRRPEVKIAILESARGGLLRRGLAVDACDAALITNVQDDHLGEFGIVDLDAMARTKAVVASVVHAEGRVVLPADDVHLVPIADGLPAAVTWFALDPENVVVVEHVAAGGTAFVVEDGTFVRRAGKSRTALGTVARAPLTFGGAAVYNVRNILGAAALAHALGLPDTAVRKAIRTFGKRTGDNPGRAQLLEVRGIRLLLDFGHNPAGFKGVIALVRSLQQQHRRSRMIAVTAQAGDCSDDDLRALAVELAAGAPAHVILWDSEHLQRNRPLGEVPEVLARDLANSGIPEKAISIAESELAALERALGLARKGDLIVLMPHIDREGVARYLGQT